MNLYVILALIIIGIVIYVVAFKFKPDILSEVRSKIPTKVESLKIPTSKPEGLTSSQVQETNEKIALLQEQIRTGTVT